MPEPRTTWSRGVSQHVPCGWRGNRRGSSSLNQAWRKYLEDLWNQPNRLFLSGLPFPALPLWFHLLCKHRKLGVQPSLQAGLERKQGALQPGPRKGLRHRSSGRTQGPGPHPPVPVEASLRQHWVSPGALPDTLPGPESSLPGLPLGLWGHSPVPRDKAQAEDQDWLPTHHWLWMREEWPFFLARGRWWKCLRWRKPRLFSYLAGKSQPPPWQGRSHFQLLTDSGGKHPAATRVASRLDSSSLCLHRAASAGWPGLLPLHVEAQSKLLCRRANDLPPLIRVWGPLTYQARLLKQLRNVGRKGHVLALTTLGCREASALHRPKHDSKS